MNFKTVSIFLACIFLTSIPGSLGASDKKEAGPQTTGSSENTRANVRTRSRLGMIADRLGLGSGFADSGIAAPSRNRMEERLEPCLGSLIDTIIVMGNTRTKTHAILREMATKQGDELDLEKIMRDDSYLRGMGFFSRLDINVEKTDQGRCRVVISVEDRPDLFMKYPFPVVNYDFEKGVSYGMRWRVKNFRGVGENLMISFEKLREKEHFGGVYWNIPWAAGHRLRLGSGYFTYKRFDIPETDEFIRERNGLTLLVGLPLSDDLVRQVWLTPEITFEDRFSRLSINGYSSEPEGIMVRQKLLSWGLSLSFDSRDKVIAPMRGVYAAFRVMKFSSIEGHDQQYTLFRLVSNNYIPLGGYGTLIAAFSSDNRDGQLPSFYKVDLGGKSDVRGFDNEGYRERSKITGTIQWRKQVFGPVVWKIPLVGSFDVTVNSVVFVDSGALMDGYNEIGDSKFHTTGGFGVEILSPFQDMIRIETAKASGTPPVIYVTSNFLF